MSLTIPLWLLCAVGALAALVALRAVQVFWWPTIWFSWRMGEWQQPCALAAAYFILGYLVGGAS